jgi:hypothetical protein
MPLSAAQPGLEAQIFAALKKAQLSKNAESATQSLAKDLALAIHTYALQATVNPGQVVTTPPGVVVVGASPAGPVTGATTAPGIGTVTTPGTLS